MADLTAFISVSIVMSAIILALWIFNKIFSKVFSAKARYAIWCVVLIGLLLPFRPVIGDGVVTVEYPETAQTQQTASQSAASYEASQQVQAASGETGTEGITSIFSKLWNSPIELLLLVWGLTALIIFAVHIIRYIRFIKMIKRWGEPVKEERILSVLRLVQEQAGLSGKKIRLIKCELVSSSMLTGFIRPTILLPEGDFDDDELHMIFKHELTHYKHHDLFIKLLSVITSSLHWFNPFVYLMNFELQADGEAACDEVVTQDANVDDRRFYGEVIIGMAGSSKNVRTSFSTCFYAGKSNMKRRLASIMNTKSAKGKLGVVGVVLISAMTIFSGSVIVFAAQIPAEPAAAEYSSEISMEDAGETALKKVGGGVVTKCDRSGGYYEITIEYENNEYSMSVDVYTAEIIDFETKETEQAASISDAENDTSSNQSDNTSSNIKISQSEAKEIALAKVGGGEIIKCELDDDDGKEVYEIEIIYNNREYSMKVGIFDSLITDYETDEIDDD